MERIALSCTTNSRRLGRAWRSACPLIWGGNGSGNSGPSLKPSNWKTRICNKWEMTGYCPFISNCHFAHGAAGFSSLSSPPPYGSSIRQLTGVVAPWFRLRVLDKRKDAVKKVIAAMTVGILGKDVSSLFKDVVNCMQTENLELKKLVYLYLINYAKSQPDLAILAVNTFVKDSQDPNPLIRALAVRTMGCIRVDKITEYLCDPLQRCLKDDDPYVRKTASICVAKLYDLNAELVEDGGFLENLQDLISDNNPMVVENAVAALAEIQENSNRPIFEITSHTLSKLQL